MRALGDDAAATLVGKGVHPIWRRDGRELFFLGPHDEMMAEAPTPLPFIRGLEAWLARK